MVKLRNTPYVDPSVLSNNNNNVENSGIKEKTNYEKVDFIRMHKDLFKDLNINDLYGKLQNIGPSDYKKEIDLIKEFEKAFDTYILDLVSGKKDLPKSPKKNLTKVNPSSPKSGLSGPSIGDIENGKGNTSSVDSDSSDNTENLLEKQPVGTITMDDILFIDLYFKFKGKENNSLYKLFNGIIVKNISQHPALLSRKEYQDFIRDNILKPISESRFDEGNIKKYREDVKKLQEDSRKDLSKFQSELINKNIKGKFWSWMLDFMSNSRNEIIKVQGMNFEQLKKGKNDILKISYNNRTRTSIKKGLVEFKKNSNDEGYNKDVADYLTDENIDSIADELSSTKELFNKLRLELSYIYDYIKKYPDLAEKNKTTIEKDIKSIVSLMHFINGLEEFEWWKLKNTSLVGAIVHNLIEYNSIFGGLVALGVGGTVLSKYVYIRNRKKNFLKKIKENTKKKEHKEYIKETGKIKSLIFGEGSLNSLDTVKKVEVLIKNMSDSEGNLKEEYRKKHVEEIYNRLNKLKSVMTIRNNLGKFKGVDFNIDIIFQSEKEFSREVLKKLFSTGENIYWPSKSANLLVKGGRLYTGIGLLERIGDFAGYRPLGLFGKNKETFGKWKATEILDDFINKYLEVSIFSNNLKLLENEPNNEEKDRKKIKETVNKVQERISNKNVILSEVIVEQGFKKTNKKEKEKTIKEVKEILDGNGLFKRLRILLKAFDSSGIINSTEGLKERFKIKSNLIWFVLKDKFSITDLNGKKSLKNIGKTDFIEIMKEGDRKFEELNKKLSKDGKIDKERVKKYMTDEVNKELKILLDKDKLTESYFERLKKGKSNDIIEKLKLKREGVIEKNKKLEKPHRIEEGLIDKITDKNQLTELKKIFEDFGKIEGEMPTTFKDVIEKIIQESKTNIESAIKSEKPINIDPRIGEMLGGKGEIKNIETIIKFMKEFEGKEWFTKEIKSSIIENIKVGLNTADPLLNKINTIVTKLTEIKDIKVKEFFSGSKKDKVLNEKKTKELFNNNVLDKVNEFKRILNITVNISEHSSSREKTSNKEKFKKLNKFKELQGKIDILTDKKAIAELRLQQLTLLSKPQLKLYFSEGKFESTLEKLNIDFKNIEKSVIEDLQRVSKELSLKTGEDYKKAKRELLEKVGKLKRIK